MRYRSFTDLPLPDLVRGLKAPDPTLRLVSAAALGLRGEQAREAVPALADALRGNDVGLRRVAVLALADLGPTAQDAVPVLREALADEDEWVRLRAPQALEAVGAKTEMPTPAAVLDRFERVIGEAVRVLDGVTGDSQTGTDEQPRETPRKTRRKRSRQPAEEVVSEGAKDTPEDEGQTVAGQADSTTVSDERGNALGETVAA